MCHTISNGMKKCTQNESSRLVLRIKYKNIILILKAEQISI